MSELNEYEEETPDVAVPETSVAEAPIESASETTESTTTLEQGESPAEPPAEPDVVPSAESLADESVEQTVMENQAAGPAQEALNAPENGGAAEWQPGAPADVESPVSTNETPDTVVPEWQPNAAEQNSATYETGAEWGTMQKQPEALAAEATGVDAGDSKELDTQEEQGQQASSEDKESPYEQTIERVGKLDALRNTLGAAVVGGSLVLNPAGHGKEVVVTNPPQHEMPAHSHEAPETPDPLEDLDDGLEQLKNEKKEREDSIRR
jgi:hypothetical protein